MSRLLRLTVAGVVLVAVVALLPTTGLAQSVACSTPTETSIHCVATVSGMTSDGGTNTATCVVGGPVCEYEDCHIYIDDDSQSPDGVLWDGSPQTRPAIAAFLPHGEATVPIAGALAGTFPGYLAESGQWVQCFIKDGSLPEDEQLAAGNFEVWWGPLGDELIDVDALLEQAYTEAEPPEPPVRRAPPTRSVAKMPTWFWLDEPYWVTYVGDESSPSGRLTVNVFAEPIETVWSTGEGSITCVDGPGSPYDIGLDPDSGECMWVYQHESSTVGGTYRVDGEVLFTVEWQMVFDNGTTYDRGELPPYYVSAGWDTVVSAIHALVVSEPGASGDGLD